MNEMKDGQTNGVLKEKGKGDERGQKEIRVELRHHTKGEQITPGHQIHHITLE